MADHGPRRSPAKRRAILDAAIQVFTDLGYARASVDAIAAQAGVGKQTVYGHFGDKEQLFLAAIQEARSAVAGAPGRNAPATGGPAGRGTSAGGGPAGRGTAAGGGQTGRDASAGGGPVGRGGMARAGVVFTGDPREDLTALGEWTLDIALSPRVAALHRLTIAEVGHHPELQRTWRASSSSLGGGVADYLRACDSDGRLRVPDPDRAARQFSHLVVSEARVDTAYGMLPLPPERRHAIAADAADLIVRAHHV
ncbi:TetR/AcrR family transcriptional regulator [Nonomuraea sp. NPDC026600]|uniref:TetR/AcrR family transcriptional regulator n=1 Tax=Nonomuraea sp. NPDC026600 TaxID=3155363 RepID=UPI0033BFE7E2